MKEALLLIVVVVISLLLVRRLQISRRKPIRGYLDMIDLNEEQKRQVEEIRKDFLPRVAAIRQALRNDRLELNDLLFAEHPDIQAVIDKSMEIAKLQAELEREVIEHILQEKELLTSEQKRRFHEVIRAEFEKGGLGVHGERK